MSEEEIWKVYPKIPFIEVSNLGRVRTKDKIVTDRNGKKYHIKGRILKQSDNGHGYVYVAFMLNGKTVHLYVHRIVAICFIPNPNNLPEINHKDNDRTNNAVSNLEWCTREYNIAYRERCGISAKESTKVLRNPVIAIDLNNFKVLWFESQMEAERQLGVDNSNITKVVKGKRNKTGDYWFCYVDSTAVEKVRTRFGDEVAKKVEKLISENKKVSKSC